MEKIDYTGQDTNCAVDKNYCAVSNASQHQQC